MNCFFLPPGRVGACLGSVLGIRHRSAPRDRHRYSRRRGLLPGAAAAGGRSRPALRPHPPRECGHGRQMMPPTMTGGCYDHDESPIARHHTKKAPVWRGRSHGPIKRRNFWFTRFLLFFQPLEPVLGLRPHILRRRAAVTGPALDRCLHREHAEDVRGDLRLDVLHPVQRHLMERDALLDARPTMRPVTWCASRNGSFSVRTSQSARSVAVA